MAKRLSSLFIFSVLLCNFSWCGPLVSRKKDKLNCSCLSPSKHAKEFYSAILFGDSFRKIKSDCKPYG